MKRNLFHIFAVAAAAVAFAACSADSDIDSPRPDEGYTITLRTDGIIGDTRTEFDPAINQIKWSSSDQAVFYSNGIGRISKITLVDGGKFAEFKLLSMRPEMQEDRTRTIQGFYPVEARWNDGHQRDENNQITAFALNLKSRQEAPSTTFDPQADILVAENLQIELADGETEKTIENVRFGRPVAITEIKYVISNETLKASNEQVRSITLHVESPNETKFLAGNFYFNPETFRYVDVDGNVLNTDNSDFFDSARASSVQVMLSDNPAVNSDFTAWVVTAPVALTAGDTLEFIIRTTAGTVITKTVEVNKTVAFSNTRRNTLTVKIDDNATIATGSATAIEDGYYVIATDDTMMMAEQFGSSSNTLGYATLPTEYVDGKLSVGEDKAIWYIDHVGQDDEGRNLYNISSKLNGKFINCTAAKSCYLKDEATTLMIQPATNEGGKYNISVKDNGWILYYNNGSPRFAFYNSSKTMTGNLNIIPVYVDNTPSFTLLKNKITVSAVGDYTEKDVYQLRNASAANILIDVDGEVVTSASIADAAVTFTVAKAEADTNGSIDLDFNGTKHHIDVVISAASPTATLTYENIADMLDTKYSTGEYNGWSWNAMKNNNGIQINGSGKYIKIPDNGSAITNVKITTSTTYKSGYKLYLSSSTATSAAVKTITSGGNSAFEFDLTDLTEQYTSLYILSGNAIYISKVEVTYAN